MFSLFDINHRLQKLTLSRIKQMCRRNKTVIDDQKLKVILKIIKDNPHAVIDEDYQHNRNPFIDHPEFVIMIYDKNYDGPGALLDGNLK